MYSVGARYTKKEEASYNLLIYFLVSKMLKSLFELFKSFPSAWEDSPQILATSVVNTYVLLFDPPLFSHMTHRPR